MNWDIRSIGSIRKKLSLTQKALARLAGVSQSLIAKIESGKIDPAYSKIVAINQALEMEINRKKQIKKAKDIMSKNIVAVSPRDTLDETARTMKKKAISQLPVFDGRTYIGSITEEMFVNWFTKYGKDLEKIKVYDVMQECFPIIPSHSNLDLIIEMLKFYKALLVAENGKVIGIITKADLIKTLNSG